MGKLFLISDNSDYKKVLVKNSDKVQNAGGMAGTLGTITSEKVITQADGELHYLKNTDAAKLQVATGYNSLRNITAACHAINNSRMDTPTKTYDWYPEMKKNFGHAQKLSRKWIDDLSVDITSNIPSSILDFKATYDASDMVIHKVLEKYDGADTLSEKDLHVVRSILQKVVEKTNSIEKRTKTLDDEMKKWGTDMYDIFEKINSENSNVSSAIVSINAQIETYNKQVARIESDLEGYYKRVSAGAGLVGCGAFVALLGGCLCLACPVAGGMVICVGLGCIGGGGIVWGLCDAAIRESQKELVNIRNSIAADEQLIVSLKTIDLSVKAANTACVNARSNLNDFRFIWNTFGKTLSDLNEALANESTESMAALIDFYDEEARNNWSELNKFALEFQASSEEVKVETSVA